MVFVVILNTKTAINEGPAACINNFGAFKTNDREYPLLDKKDRDLFPFWSFVLQIRFNDQKNN